MVVSRGGEGWEAVRGKAGKRGKGGEVEILKGWEVEEIEGK